MKYAILLLSATVFAGEKEMSGPYIALGANITKIEAEVGAWGQHTRQAIGSALD